MHEFPEHDWKVFKKLQVQAHFRYAQRALDEAGRILADQAKDPYERFDALAKLMREREEEFNGSLTDHRRSAAFYVTSIFYRLGLVTDQELEQFTDQTQQSVRQTRQW
jgi:hypothetical protein